MLSFPRADMPPADSIAPSLSLLHLEDSVVDAELIGIQLLKEWPQCRIERVETRAQFLSALRSEHFDLVLSDFSLPAFNGMDALALTCAQASPPPFLFLSGTIGEDHAVEALQHGAVDYVIKDRPARLIPAIKRALERARERRAHARTELALREQAEVLDKARDAICVTDVHGRITYSNRSAVELFCLHGSEHPETARSLDDLFGAHNRGLLTEALRQLHATGAWTGELQLATPSGEHRHVISRWTLVRDDRNQPKSILSINTDLTERKKLEVQLLRSQRLDGIGTLAGGIAHDLNNVLTPILTSVSVLQLKVADPELRRLIGVVETSARHGAALIRQVLTFARGVEGSRCEIQLQSVISDVVTLLRETLPRSIEIVTEVSDDLWSVNANSTQLSQVLMNLGINARDAIAGRGQLTIRARNAIVDTTLAQATPGAQPGPHVLIAVRDTGSGIPPQSIDRIFDPFFTTKPAGEGTGLGLSTVLGIVKGHGGFLQVESSLGQGTEFILHFPATSSRAAAATSTPPDAGWIRGHGETVLLIDDEQGVREVLHALLEAYGYRVLVAQDGADGLALFREHRSEIGVVLTDMMMPGIQGAEVIQELRRIDPQARIVAMSGVTGEETAAAEKLAHLTFLPKPMTGDELLGAVRRMLSSA